MNEDKKKKLVPGPELPMTALAGLLFGATQNRDLKLIALDLRGTFRVGGDQIEGSVTGGGGGDWKLYLADSWEYRYLIDKELRSLKIRKCDRIVSVFEHEKTGAMYQGRVLEKDGKCEWKFVEMKPQED